MSLYRIRVRGTGAKHKNAPVQEGIDSPDPKFIVKKRSSWTGKELCFYSVQRSSPSR